MTAEQAGVLLLDLAIIIILARSLGALARLVGQPAVIGEITAGILLGPTLVDGAIAATVLPTDIRPFLAALANVGLVLFMFIVGLELEAKLIRGRERVAASVSIGSIVLPFALGSILALYLYERYPGERGFLPFVLFLGASMSVTAFPVLARILTDRGMHRTALGGLALACAAVDDVLAWSILAVVIAIGGGGGDDQWRVLLTVPYVLLMFFAVRPLLRRILPAYRRAGRLSPQILAVVLVGLLLSSWAAEWLHVHFIFGAFLFGAIMPREGAEALRHEILERLEQVAVLLLLPVFFVVAGLRVDLSTVDLAGLGDLGLILLVAITGKFAGAYAGARLQRVRHRQAAALATLMNTRGLTEIVILTVGLQLGILDGPLFSLLVVMAVVTTVMTGPILAVIYPPARVARDIAEAERATLGTDPGHRVLVVVPDPASADAAAVVDLALDVVGGQRPAEVVLSHLRPYSSPAVEIGTGLSGELAAMAGTLDALETLASRVRARDVRPAVLSRFTDDVARDLAAQVTTTRAEVVVVAADDPAHALVRDAADGQVVTVRPAAALAGRVDGAPVAGGAVRVLWATGADGQAAAVLAARVAASRGVTLWVDDGQRPSRRAVTAVDALVAAGLDARTAPPADPPALIVAGEAAGSPDAGVIVRAERHPEPVEWAGVAATLRPAVQLTAGS